ncbi:MAG: type II methionyl aminopeptidase [Nanoarchaeota archaeon]
MNVSLDDSEKHQYYKDFRQAGKYAKVVREHGKSLIKSDASYMDIYRSIIKKIESLGAQPAFPPQMSFDDIAAHYLPGPNEDMKLQEQVVKLDVGVSVNGAIGDTATTVDLSGKWSDLITASADAVKNAVAKMDVGVELREIGKEIQDVIGSYDGLTSIKNLSGHGLNPYTIHCKPTIPNYDNNDRTQLGPDMTFACEPFATTGKGMIYDSGNGWIFRMNARKPVRDPVARKIMDQAELFGGLPFSMFELDVAKIPFFKVRVALKQLERQGVLDSYGPLVEEAHGMVSQAEHSVLFDDDGKKWITTQ